MNLVLMLATLLIMGASGFYQSLLLSRHFPCRLSGMAHGSHDILANR